jgi:GTP-binding protein
VEAIFRGVPEEPLPVAEGLEEAQAEHRVYRPGDDEGFKVQRLGDGTFRVSGRRVERLIARHDMNNDDAQRYVEDRLRSMGVIRALESAGFEPGDDVEIAGMVFELDPGAPA